MEDSNPDVIQIVTGYYRSKEDSPNKYDARGSVTLVKDGSSVILVDCAGPWDSLVVREKLSEHAVELSDITHLICTHGHIDHIGNLNLFNNATIILDGDVGTEPGVFDSLKISDSFALTSNVRIICTPGHTSHDLSVVVESVPDKGIIVIAGDIFESEDDLNKPELWRCCSWNIDIQQKSREKILKLADFIIPGHGIMFQNVAKRSAC